MEEMSALLARRWYCTHAAQFITSFLFELFHQLITTVY